MSLVLCIGNEKGGVGKTTTCMNLAGILRGKFGYSVGVIDVDRQGSSTMWSLARGPNSLPFDVLPARAMLHRDLAAVTEYNFLLVDMPPGIIDSMDESARNARTLLQRADALVVPLVPGFLDYAAAAALAKFLQKTVPQLPAGVVINRRKNNRIGCVAQEKAVQLFASLESAHVFKAMIGDRTPITEVTGSGKTIADFAPSHEAAREYVELTKELLKWLESQQKKTRSI